MSPDIVPRSLGGRRLGLPVALLGTILVVVGLVFSFSARGPACDGCSPAHPLFVLAPLAVGSLLLVVGTILDRR